MNNDRDGYTRRRAQSYLAFLQKPDDTPVALGPFVDSLCRSCAFGHGNGGFHCQTLLASYESKAVTDLLSDIAQYPDELKDPSKPERYRFWKTTVPVPSHFRLDPDSFDTEVAQLQMALGFMRDVLTYK